MYKPSGTKFGSFGSTSSNFYSDKNSSYTPSTTLTQGTKESSSSKEQSKINPNDYVPKRFGLKFDPPTIILEYLIPSSGKLYHHKMKLLKLKSDSDDQEMMDYLRKRHTQYFLNNKISEQQLKNLLKKLKERLGKNEDQSSGATFLTSGGFLGENKKDSNIGFGNSSTSKNNTGTSSKLAPLAPLSNKGAKASSSDNIWDDLDNNKSSSSPFGQKASSTATTNFTLSGKGSKIQSSGFTKKDDSTNSINSRPKTAQPQSSANNTKSGGSGSNGFWDFEDFDPDEADKPKAQTTGTKELNYDTSTNLNKLSKAEIDQQKSKMDVMFNQNQVKKGDSEFVYDKQEEFEPYEDNEWDDEF